MPDGWRIMALDTGTSELEQSLLTYTVGFGRVARIPRVMWVVQGPTTVVIDTSVPMHGRSAEFIGEDFSRSAAQEPANALRDAGVDPRDVEFVVLSHLHWDHAGNCDLFPEARVLVQRDELRYAVAPGRFFRKSFLAPMSGWPSPPYLLPNLETVDGETELAPGLRLVRAPGHTPGSQAAIVETGLGSFCIAGDAISTYANIEQDIPPGFHVSVDDSVEFDGSPAGDRRPLPALARLRGVRWRAHHPDRAEPRGAAAVRPVACGPLGPRAHDGTGLVMWAARRLTPDATELAVVEVPTPVPGPGQARIAVTGAGLCGTDLHILHGDYSSRPPVTLGHEIAGVVDAVGEGVDAGWLGALVAPETAFSTCGLCRWCRTGRPMLCAERLSVGSGVDGGFAAHVLVPARLLHRLPEWLDDHAAALMEPLACVCNAILDPGVVQAGDEVLVSGAGPVGILAAQVARACGGVVTLLGTDADAERLALAATLGVAVMSVEDAAARETLAARAAARAIDVVIECAGVEAAVRSGLEWVRPGGRYVQVGLLSGLVAIPFGLVVTHEIDIRATFGSSPSAWMRATELIADRAVELEPLVSAVLPITGWREAIERLETRRGLKTVLDPRVG